FYSPWLNLSLTRRLPLFFCTDTSPPQIYTLSLHDALPISHQHQRRLLFDGLCRHEPHRRPAHRLADRLGIGCVVLVPLDERLHRSEEHTSELQSRENLVCRLLLEKKNNSLSHLLIDHPSFL